MPLTATAIRNAKSDNKRARRLFDALGLYLEISPAGGRWWRFEYRFGGKEKRLSLGVHGDVSLKEARDRRDDARKLLAAGVDPSAHRKANEREAAIREANSLEAVARERHAKQGTGWTTGHADDVMRRPERNLLPDLGARPIAEITASELLSVARTIESRGAHDLSHRIGPTYGHARGISMHIRALIVGLLLLLNTPYARAQPTPCPGVSPWVFLDVPGSDAFCGSITFMATSGVTTGCQIIDANNRLYCPDSFVTRKQMAGFMDRLSDRAVFAQGGNAFGASAVLGTNDNQPLDIRVNGSRVMRYESTQNAPNIIGGHPNNSALSATTAAVGATVGGGGNGSSGCRNPFGGPSTCANRAGGTWPTVGGGSGNYAVDHATVAGGRENFAYFFSTVSGGGYNTADGAASTVAGGSSNTASGNYSAVAGGTNNVASGHESMVAGGASNAASGYGSFAAGIRAKAVHGRSFVWNGDANNDTSSMAEGDFVVYAPGRVRMFAGAYGTGGCEIGTFNVGGNLSCQGLITALSFVPLSDRALKTVVAPVDPKAVLARVVSLPITEWSYTTAPEVRHIGPMGQDFHAAFGLGATDRGIATVDADGVALAAIQGLNAKHEAERAAKNAEIAALKRDLAELRAAVETLRAGLSAEGVVAHAR